MTLAIDIKQKNNQYYLFITRITHFTSEEKNTGKISPILRSYQEILKESEIETVKESKYFKEKVKVELNFRTSTVNCATHLYNKYTNTLDEAIESFENQQKLYMNRINETNRLSFLFPDSLTIKSNAMNILLSLTKTARRIAKEDSIVILELIPTFESLFNKDQLNQIKSGWVSASFKQLLENWKSTLSEYDKKEDTQPPKLN